jgi:hypothetical protein
MSDKDVDVGLKVNPEGNSEYDYHELLERGACFHCARALNWELTIKGPQDDRFCRATCCGLIYSMIPARVKVIAALEALEDTAVFEEEEICDEDFLKELESI